ncbi:MAG: NAD-binding protein, partial [Thermoguttaceae bacterium]|nr:NAD-binding protein [Thermoguttaceae bacterium]
DVISLTGTAEDIITVSKKYFNAKAPKAERVMIMGGGETGYYIAQALEHANFEVIIFERDKARCEFLAKHLSKSVSVVHANGLSRRDLEENQIDSVDSFIACTGDDENNIMGAVEAKELGAKQVFAVVTRPDYAAIVKKLGIDRVVSPRTVIANRVRGFLNTGAIVMRTQLANQSDIEVMEIEALAGSEACQKTIRNLGLPAQCLIAGINSSGFVQTPDADYQIKPGDLVIMLVQNQVFEQAMEKFKV